MPDAPQKVLGEGVSARRRLQMPASPSKQPIPGSQVLSAVTLAPRSVGHPFSLLCLSQQSTAQGGEPMAPPECSGTEDRVTLPR